jgi:T5SS/PEP-CTERM-associated repeat protein/probable HAF family extracellular repeat protein
MSAKHAITLPAILVILFAGTPVAGAILQPLGYLTGGGSTSSAFGVSDNIVLSASDVGSFVVGESDSASGEPTEAVLWEINWSKMTNTPKAVGDLPGAPWLSGAWDVTDQQVVVGYGHPPLGEEAFRWQSNLFDGLGNLRPGTPNSRAYAVTHVHPFSIEMVVVGSSGYRLGPFTQKEAFRWTDAVGTMQGLGHLYTGSVITQSVSEAFGVADHGRVVVGYSKNDQGNMEAFRWTDLNANGSVDPAERLSVNPEKFGLGDLPGGIFRSVAWDASGDGQVVVGYGNSDSGTEAFRWTEDGGMVGLGDLKGAPGRPDEFHSWAMEVSEDGSIVVGSSRSGTVDTAFVWDNTNGMQSLKDVLVNDCGLQNLTGWTLNVANAVSPDGNTIVGNGTNNGIQQAWAVQLPLNLRWEGTFGNQWVTPGIPSNWSLPHAIPRPVTNVSITKPDAAVVGPPMPTRITSLTVGSTGGPAAKLALQPNAPLMVKGHVSVGGPGGGEIIIPPGGSLSSTLATITAGSQAVSRVLVDGPGASGNFGSLYTAGGDGQTDGEAILTVQHGASVSVDETLSVSGAKAAPNVEIVAGGSLTVGTNTTPGEATIGAEPDGFGWTLVAGRGGRSGLPSTWQVTGPLHVGHTGVGRLEVETEGVVQSSDGFIGLLVGSQGHALVSGAGSTWDTSGVLHVGSSGIGTMEIVDGGTVSSRAGFIGFDSPSLGEVVVSGAGSTWDIRIPTIVGGGPLYVGHSGTGSLEVTNGGVVRNSDGHIGFLDGSAGHVHIVGTGSTWNNSGGLHVGSSGISGMMEIVDGGTVLNTDGFIGFNAGSQGEVLVSGSGSTWDNSGVLHVGSSGTGTMDIVDGGTVLNTDGFIGFNSGSQGEVLVSGSGSTWDNSGVLHVGSSGTGTMEIIDGGTVLNTDGFIGFNTGSRGEVLVSGAGSTWNNRGVLHVGSSGMGRLRIVDGGTVLNTHGFIGFNPGSLGDVLVSGPGSTWNNHGDLHVGHSGVGTMEIVDGGTVVNADGFIGFNPGSQGDVLVRGRDSTWDNHGVLHVGHLGTGTLMVRNGGRVRSGHLHVGHSGVGTMEIVDGGTVVNDNGFIGFNPGSQGDVLVRGRDSTWDNHGVLHVGHLGTGSLEVHVGGTVLSNDLHVGSSGTGFLEVHDGGVVRSKQLYVGSSGIGTMEIVDGGRVFDKDGFIGFLAGSQGRVGVGVSSTWDNSGVLHVGSSGTGALEIVDGGTVSNIDGFIGFNPGSQGDVLVHGARSSWVNSGALHVGSSGTGALQIVDGGTVLNTDGFIGFNPNSIGDVLVSGAGSSWDNSGALHVGSSGTGSLQIVGGGTVSNADGFIGFNPSSRGDVLVRGRDSTWNNHGVLHVGSSGMGRLRIVDGGTVLNTHGFIGFNPGSRGDVLVSGHDSTWDNHGVLHVGHLGTGSLEVQDGGRVRSGDLHVGFSGVGTMEIVDGSTVVNTDGFIGFNSGSRGDVLVRGRDSTWENRGVLHVGHTGTGSLEVHAGGTVLSNDLHVGFSGTGSLEVHDGGGVRCNDLHIGSSGVGTMDIFNGGTVLNTDGFIGFNAGSQGDVLVRGRDSTWENGGVLHVGSSGAGALEIVDGGTVLNTDGIIGFNPGSQGGVVVSGAGSTWDNTGVLHVAHLGTGSLEVNNGGRVRSNDLHVGHSGVGTMEIVDGGTVVNADGFIGFNPGSQGDVLVRGRDSTWDNHGVLHVGSSGRGALDILDGGTVLNTDGFIGFNPRSDGHVRVSGAGSTWDNSGVLHVGSSGRGTLEIVHGGTVVNTDGFIGFNSGSLGAVVVSGAASAWNNSGSLHVGSSGRGTLEIVNGGTVLSTDGFVGYNRSSQGTVTVRDKGSHWDIFGSLYVGGSKNAAGGTGQVTIRDGGAVNVRGSLKVWNNGTVRVSGGSLTTNSVTLAADSILSGLGIIDAPVTVDNGATVSPGDPVGILTVLQDYTQDSMGELLIELGGTSPGEFDVLDIGGAASLNGNLQVDLIDPFTPSAGDVFDILNWGSLSGTFETVNLPTLADGLSWDTSDLYVTGTLGIFPGPFPCDVNADGVCDVADIDLLVEEIIAGTNDAGFDLNGDGVVDVADQDEWRSLAAAEHGFSDAYLYGDANLDGAVDASDLNVVGLNWRQTSNGWSQGDFDCSGFVDAGDLNLLALNWQGSTPVPAAAQAVPEPSYLGLLVSGCVAAWVLTHVRRS